MAASLRKHLVDYFESHQKLVEAEALDLLLSEPHPLVLSQELVERTGSATPFVTRELVLEVLAQSRAPEPRRRTLGGHEGPALPKAPVSSAEGYQLLLEGYAAPPATETPLQAYAALFQSRFRTLSRLLRGRPELGNLRPIRELRASDEVASLIGMVRTVRETTQRRHLILTLDDETGSIDLLIPRDSAVGRTTFLPDEVVGVRVEVPSEARRLPRVVSVERPDVPRTRTVGRARRPVRALFLSDLHIGSRSFLGENWEALVECLRGQGPLGALAATIGYVVIAGDLVDGIGVYPRQERDLAISDIVEQYAELGRRLGQLSERLTVVVVPGNHDAVCPAEPQPALPPNLAVGLPPNVRVLSNPSTFALDGVVVTAYHGRSFDDLIPAIPKASYALPTEVMKRMVQMRHLAPIYGDRTPLAPGGRDGLVLDYPPDILVTGHAHTYGADRYRGVLLLNASTWQAETEYQKMRNITPVPARAALVDLSNLALTTLDFSQQPAVAAESAA